MAFCKCNDVDTSCTTHTNAVSAQHTHTLHTVTQQFTRKPNTHTHTHTHTHTESATTHKFKQLNKHKQLNNRTRQPQPASLQPATTRRDLLLPIAEITICCCQVKLRPAAAKSNPSSREPWAVRISAICCCQLPSEAAICCQVKSRPSSREPWPPICCSKAESSLPEPDFEAFRFPPSTFKFQASTFFKFPKSYPF